MTRLRNAGAMSAVLLVAVLALSGCNKSDTSNQSTPQGSPTQSAQPPASIGPITLPPKIEGPDDQTPRNINYDHFRCDILGQDEVQNAIGKLTEMPDFNARPCTYRSEAYDLQVIVGPADSAMLQKSNYPNAGARPCPTLDGFTDLSENRVIAVCVLDNGVVAVLINKHDRPLVSHQEDAVRDLANRIVDRVA